MAYNVLDAIKDAVFHSDTCYVEKEEAERRASICDKCPFKKRLNRCDLCGCYLPAKVRFVQSECPDNRW